MSNAIKNLNKNPMHGWRHDVTVEHDFAVVIPETKKTLSPLALWEAAEAAKFKVIRIETPIQTFETKPVEPAG